MAAGDMLKWKLKKFSHFKRVSKKDAGKWTDYDADDGKPELMFNVAESGHVWVTQSQELLDFAMVSPGGSAKVKPSSDVLIIRSSIQGETRIMRLMFAGRSREEAVEQCSSAANKLKQFDVCPVEGPLPPADPNQPPTEPLSAAAMQTGPGVGEVVGSEPEVVRGSLSVRHLAQGLLGQRTLSLPEMYHHCSEDLGPFVRMCILDPAFPAYVEEVERQLKKLAQD